MKNNVWALFGLIIGSALLSLEGFLLRLIQMLDKTTGCWHSNVWVYAKEPILLISLTITICIIVVSVVAFFNKPK